jgi:hypothetical protein
VVGVTSQVLTSMQMPNSTGGPEMQDAQEDRLLPRPKAPKFDPRRSASLVKQPQETVVRDELGVAEAQRRPSGGQPTARTKVDQPACPEDVQVEGGSERGETGTGGRPSTPHQQEDDGDNEQVVHHAKVAEEAPHTPVSRR